MTVKRRVYISLYYKDSVSSFRKKGYITLAFNADSLLYKECKKLGAAKIKELIAAKSFGDLEEKAGKDARSVNNYIKYILSKNLKIPHE